MEKIVVFTGAGVSAESGLKTFRDLDGIWNEVDLMEVATPEAFARQPELVLAFYNERRKQLGEVEPNAAHRAIARLEERFEVTVVTQNVDDLHERAGSNRVIHLHGRLTEVRSTADPSLVLDWGYRPLELGDRCERGSQLRPNIVWFGEEVPALESGAAEMETADRVLVVGSSLSVYPAAGLLWHAAPAAKRVAIDPNLHTAPPGYEVRRGKAGMLVPPLVEEWLLEP